MWNKTNDIAHKNDAAKGDSKQIKNIYLKNVISKITKFREAFDFVIYSQGPYHQLINFYVAKDVNFFFRRILCNSEKMTTAQIIFLALDFVAITNGYLEPDVLSFTRRQNRYIYKLCKTTFIC
jgi:hypothetical protein